MSAYYYQANEVKRKGKTDGCYKTDLLAMDILDGTKDPFENVTPSKRKDYRMATHVRSNFPPYPNSNRKEEIEAIHMFAELKECVLDYQVPLTERKGEYTPGDKPKGRGDIDLLLKLDGALYLTELKGKSCPKESLLRAVLEIETYYRMVDKDLLKAQYGCADLPLKKAILLHKDDSCRPYQEWLNKKDFPHVHKLLSKWKIQVFTVEELFKDFVCE